MTMPVRKKTLRRRDLPNDWDIYLRIGGRLFGGKYDDPGQNDEFWREIWERKRDEVMAGCAEHNKRDYPARPWGWWKFEHDDDRIQVYARPWGQAARLFLMGVLSPDEIEQFKAALLRDLPIHRMRIGMPGEGTAVEEIKALLAELDGSASG